MWPRAATVACAALALAAFASAEGSSAAAGGLGEPDWEPAADQAQCARSRDVDAPSCNPHYADPQCKLLDPKKFLTLLLQGVLALMGIASLLAKKRLEERRPGGRRRSYKVWGMDVSKQAAASMCAHAAGIINAGILDGMNSDSQSNGRIINTDPCGWYFVSFTLDTTLGVFLSYCMFRLQVYLTAGATSEWVGDLGRSGDYENLDGHGAVNYRRWGIQMAVWCLITVLARLMVLGVQVLLFPVLRVFVAVLSQSMACHPDAMLVLVMVACPVLMNIGMLWIQDQFLKKQPAVSAAQEQRESVMEQRKPSYLKRQKKVCNIILGTIGFVLISLVVLWYTVLVGSEQDYYDPCYTQVRDVVTQARANGRSDVKVSDLLLAEGHLFEVVHDTCKAEDGNLLKYVLEHRGDLMGNPHDENPKPLCRCCNNRSPWTKDGGDVNSSAITCKKPVEGNVAFDCSGVGECCGRSQLHDMDKELVDSCSVCPIYMPCDQLYCPARADFIRNTQHLPMIFGVILSMAGNIYVLYTYKFDEKLQKAAITKLLSWAALIEVVFCVSILIQELLFRVPRDPCVPETDLNGDGFLANSDCQDATQWHDWPTYSEVYKQLVVQLSDHEVGQVAGQRGGAVAGCQAMSFIFQLTWTASDSYYWMITVELMLNLYTSPFGSTKKRWWFYHGWTWSVSLILAVWLMVSGDWGVSFDSVLEDFCWNVNFGHSGYGQVRFQ